MKSKRIYRGSVLRGTIFLSLLFTLICIQESYSKEIPLSEKIYQQQRTITGKVIDTKGVPLPGVSVVVKGKQGKGVATDFDGNYTIEVAPDDTLIFSYIGFITQEIAVKGKTKINVILRDDVQKLDEVVVVGYGTMRKKDLTGSIVSVKPSEDLVATASSFDNLLQGKVAGVNISSSGSTPGGASSVIIRGANSLNGSSQPLYVIDNVPQSSSSNVRGSGDFEIPQDPLAGINPNDILDIQILKDASATAIYGSRGANGVILITTKKGKKGKTKITLTANTTITSASSLPSLMNLKEYAAYENATNPTAPNFEIKGDEVLYTYENTSGKSTTRSVEYKNWMKEALRTAFSTKYNISANGGTSAFRYNISVGYRNIEGIVKKTGLRHGDFRINLGLDLTKNLNLSLVTSGFIRQNNMMSGGTATGKAAGGIISNAIIYKPYEMPKDDKDAQSDDNKYTVMSWLNDYDDTNDQTSFSISGDLKYKFWKDFDYTLRLGGNLNDVNHSNWYGLELSRGKANNGFILKRELASSNYNVENLLNYKKNLGEFYLTAMVGITYDAYKHLDKSLEAKDFPFYSLRGKGTSIANSILVHPSIQADYQLLSYLSRVNLSMFDGKYIITSTFRADGSSKFAKGKRWAYFPSFALAWNMKQEKFLKNFKTLNKLKLRLGYGVTGSQNINPYNTIPGYVVSGGYATPEGEKTIGLGISKIVNTNLTWETTSSYNIGIDFGLYKNRIYGAVDLYSKKTSNLLLAYTLPGSTSFGSITINKGAIANKGVEVSLNMDIIKSKQVNWSIGGNISFNDPRIENLGLPLTDRLGTLENIRYFTGGGINTALGAANIFVEGKAPGLLFGYETDGIVQKDEENSYTQSLGEPFADGGFGNAGNLKFRDVNGDGKVDLNDRTIIGNPNPDFNYGFQTSFKYKRMRLSASFEGVKGGDIVNYYSFLLNLPSTWNLRHNMNPVATANAWTEQKPSNFYPAIRSKPLTGEVVDRYIEDGSYLRCTNITLGYDLNAKVVKKIGMSRINFYLSVKDLFTITNYSGLDVTSRSYTFDPLRRGIDLYSYPSQRSFILGAGFTF